MASSNFFMLKDIKKLMINELPITEFMEASIVLLAEANPTFTLELMSIYYGILMVAIDS